MADDRLEAALAQHFYRAACRWAQVDGEPVEALVLDRFLVAAQDAVASLGLISEDDIPTWLAVPWWSRLGWWLRPYWHYTDTRVWRWQRKPCRSAVCDLTYPHVSHILNAHDSRQPTGFCWGIPTSEGSTEP